MADIIDEINEELKKDKLLQFWKKYQKYLISIIVLFLFSLISYQIYSFWINNTNNKSADIFYNAMNSKDFSQSILNKENDLNRGYEMLALFKKASQFSEKGNNEEASNLYLDIYYDESQDEFYREIALLLSIMHSKEKNEKLLSNLNDLISKDTPLKGIALELDMGIKLNEGKIKEAINNLNQILSLSEISPSQRKRISDLLIILKTF